MASNGPCQIDGASVVALASHSINISECQRLFGANEKSKMVQDTDILVAKDTSTECVRTFVDVKWNISPTRNKVKCMQLRLLTAVHQDGLKNPNLLGNTDTSGTVLCHGTE